MVLINTWAIWAQVAGKAIVLSCSVDLERVQAKVWSTTSMLRMGTTFAFEGSQTGLQMFSRRCGGVSATGTPS